MDHGSIRQVWASALDLLYPPRCVGCEEMGAWLCDRCLNEVSWISPPFCVRCGSALVEFPARLCMRCRAAPLRIDRIRSAVLSAGALREAIHAFKYDGVTALAEPLGGLMATYWYRHPMSVDVVVPVPLHASRLRRRGFNQAAYLTRELARQVELTVDEGILIRHRRTVAQVGLDTEERKENVRDAFRCIGDGAAGKRVLLIDDVFTTGSTLEACAVALRRGGARSVQAVTLARAR